MIKFYRGSKEKYNQDSHGDGIYFAADSKEIVANGATYGKNADASKTTADIIVAGGPLADDITQNWPSEWVKDGNKVIPSGTSVQDILQGLFLKTVEGTVTWGNKSWNPSLNNPTVTLSSDGPVEVGSSVTATVVTTSTVSNNTRSVTCTTTQGYFDSVDGNYVSGNKTVSKTGSASGTLSVSYSWNGNAVSEFESGKTTLKVQEGSNEFKASQSGITASVEALPTTTVYASTNTKSVLANASATMTDTKPADKALTSSNTDSLTGSYYYFVGQVSGTGLEFTSDMVRNLSKYFVSQKQGTELLSEVVVSAGGNTYIIAVPEGHTITQIKALGDDARGAWMSDGEAKATLDIVLPDNSTKAYNIFYCDNVGGADSKFTNLKLGVG